MLVLLPPSEQKAPGGSGPPLGAGAPALSTPALADTRAQVVDAVTALAGEDPAKAAEVLRLPASVAEDALADARAVRTSPTTPALERYTGVLYGALDVPTLTAGARDRAGDAVCVFSGLLGLVRGRDLVPAYRVPAGADVPGLGVLARLWRPAVRDLLADLLGDEGFAVDLRSADYAAMGTPGGSVRERVVPVRVLQRRGTGVNARERVVSYHSKVGKGLLARALVQRPEPVRSVGDVAEAGAALGWEPRPRTLAGGQPGLDLVDGGDAAGP